MHISAAFLAVLGAGAYWCYRRRAIGQAHSGVGDAAQTIRSACRRKRFRNKVESSPIAAVNDPAAAAAAFLISLAASRGGLTPESEAAIKAEIRDVMALPHVDDAFVFAR